MTERALSESVGVTKSTKKKNKNRVLFWAIECRYSVILDTVTSIEWKLVEDERLESKVNLFWIDVAAIHERFRTILPWQMINHFPGMPNIARKNRMGQNLNRMQRMFPKEYSFYPRTWILPGELNEFRNQFDSSGVSLNNKIFIIKPDAGCQGRGIFLTRTLDTVPINENVVAQVYIKKPMLLDNFKFDLRIYVYVACVKPLRMYLFHDGLVRMCTEEYVKPTKNNLNMMCMHLTNYAVNKHNNNFAQPVGIDDQDHSSKRSLQWFMVHVANTHGAAKAEWLWRRIGVLCTRTVVSILPTLSREYDAHFRTFSNIPVDPSQVPGFGAPTGTSSTSKLPVAPGSRRHSATSINAGNRANKTKEGGSDEEDGAEEETEDADAPGGAEAPAKDVAAGSEDAEKKFIDPLQPKTRGSRCFEILGFDIMLEANLNPTLIEVNHLPSFGTDSALDLDVKERLMQQVFSVLPTMSDDYAVYCAHMKAEAEKRQAEKAALAEANRANSKIWRSGNSGGLGDSKPKERRREPSGDRRGSSVPRDIKESSPPTLGEESGSAIDSSSLPDLKEEPSKKLIAASLPATIVPIPEIEEVDEECTPERLEEIKSILSQIYQIFSPEKVSKIDRLMHKYMGHEEEFLRFVYAKYSVNPATYEKKYLVQQQQAAAAATAAAESSEAKEGTEAKEEENEDDASAQTDTKAAHMGRTMEMGKRISRSLSPPRNKKLSKEKEKDQSVQPNRRMSAAWKSGADEDDAFRQDVLKEHMPNEDEEWMRFEMSRLTQFTRIFPPVQKAEQVAYLAALQAAGVSGINHEQPTPQAQAEEEGEEGEEEKEEEDDEEAIAQAATAGGMVADPAKKKPATYEDIIYQVFVQDRRQTMRMRCPLPNRAKGDEGPSPFLPPLEAPSSSRPSIGSGKGVVGWKAPPKPQPKEQAPKQPTVSQLESAKRLSQGLSVAASHQQFVRKAAASTTTEPYAVVLDPNTQDPGALMAGGEVIWPSTKANRLYEEARRNRMRVEAQRNHNGAVLRQQVFFFDPNYDNMGPPSMVAGPPPGVTMQASVNTLEMGLGMTDSVYGNANPATMAAAKRPAPQLNIIANKSPTYAQYGYGHPANPVASNPNLPKQEELLKQLFPSWF